MAVYYPKSMTKSKPETQRTVSGKNKLLCISYLNYGKLKTKIKILKEARGKKISPSI